MLRYPSVVVVALSVALVGAVSRVSAAPANEMDAAVAAARQAMKAGPVDVPVLDEATLKLPEGFVYVPRAESANCCARWATTRATVWSGPCFPPAATAGSW